MSALEFEKSFDEFVLSFRGGQRLDQYRNGKSAVGLNADYFFESDGVVVELKTLEKDQAKTATLQERLEKALTHFGYNKELSAEILSGEFSPPTRVGKKLEQQMGNALRNAFRKGNRQIRASCKRLDSLAKFGVLIIANQSDFGFNAYRATHFLAGVALKSSDCAVDAIVVTTPGVDYDEGDGVPTKYWHPVYSEGNQNLGDFVEPLGFAWLEFLAKTRGEQPRIVPMENIDDKMIYARPIKKVWQSYGG